MKSMLRSGLFEIEQLPHLDGAHQRVHFAFKTWRRDGALPTLLAQ